MTPAPAPAGGAQIDWVAASAWIPVILGVLVIVGILLVLIALLVTRVTGQQVDTGAGPVKLKINRPPARTRETVPIAAPPLAAPAGANPDELAKYRQALEWHGDLTQSMVGMIEAPNQRLANERAMEWFTNLAESIGQALTTGSRQRFRVAIWIDADEPPELVAIGTFLVKRESLPLQGSVAGWVIENGRPHYVRDTRDDPIYRPLPGTSGRYRSVYAVPVAAEEPWGAITVDARDVDGFADSDMEIIAAFAGLTDAGYAAWWSEREEREADGV